MRSKCALIWSLFLTVSAFGQQAKPYTCTGRVVDSNAQAIAGAEVVCYEGFYEYERGRRRSEILGQTITSKEGRFSLEVRTTRRRSVSVVARKDRLSLGWQGASYDAPDLDFIIELSEPKVLAGEVVDETGKGIGGAKVRVCLRNEFVAGQSTLEFRAPEDWYTTRTNARGQFSFDNIPDDVTADLWVEAPGKVCCWTFWKTDGDAGEQFEAGRKDIRIVLDPEAKILGRIVNNTGDPVEGIQVLARPDKGWANYYCADLVVSDSDGRFVLKGMPAGTYSLQVVPPRDKMADWVGKDVKVMVEAGQTISDIMVPVDKGTILELVARDAKTDDLIDGLSVTVSHGANYGRHPCYWKSVVTDEAGIVRFRVPEGECNVWAGSDEYAYDREIEPIKVAKGKATRQEIRLDRNPHVSGVVRDRDGRPAEGVVVASKPTCNKTVRTDTDGRFEVSWYSRSNISKKFILAQDRQHNLAGLVEFEDVSRSVDIQLGPAFQVEGRVANPNGKGIPRASVALQAHLPGWITHVGEQVLTDANGFYQIRSIPPPQSDFTYIIEVNAKDHGPVRLGKISFEENPAKSVKIDTVVLQPADQSISGIVVDLENQPAAGIRIMLSGPRGSRTAGQPQRNVVTDEQGRFLIHRVCKGPLRIQAGYSSDPKGAGFLDAQGGDQDVKVVLGESGVHRPYMSLVSKTLPELTDLGTKLSPADIRGQMIILCFFDMSQRPSRHCISQLTRRAKTLEDKGVTILAVQASKIEENTLSEWVKKSNVPFPVGRIQGDEEKTRFAWGVKSLPWLILSDRKHTVREEGFRLVELDARMKQINKEK